MALQLDVADGIATITLDRPERLNAFNGEMRAALIETLDKTDADDAVRAVIVTGAGRAFCAGADLGGGGSTFDYGEDPGVQRDGGGTVTMRIFRSQKPIIAAINGAAVGIGITMTLPMDIRIVAEDAKIGFVFAKRGIVPEAASSWFLPRLVGISTALEWCYTGRVMTGADVAAAGLARAVPAGDVLGTARAVAAEIVESAPVSTRLIRELMWRGLTFDHPMEAHRSDSRAIQSLGRSADAREGVESFLEKREPVWTMRPSVDTPPDIFPQPDHPGFS